MFTWSKFVFLVFGIGSGWRKVKIGEDDIDVGEYQRGKT